MTESRNVQVATIETTISLALQREGTPHISTDKGKPHMLLSTFLVPEASLHVKVSTLVSSSLRLDCVRHHEKDEYSAMDASISAFSCSSEGASNAPKQQSSSMYLTWTFLFLASALHLALVPIKSPPRPVSSFSTPLQSRQDGVSPHCRALA